MKINNETKVGALTALAITLLILGFNFLKGKSLFKTGNFIYAKVKQTKGIMISNPVYINGLQIGSVYDLEETNKNVDTIIISIKLSKEVNIPVNSVASIKDNPLSSASMDISRGTSTVYLKNHDTIPTVDNPGMLGTVTAKLTPVVDQVRVTLQTLDSVLRNVNGIFDPMTKNNMREVAGNINRITGSLVVSAAALQSLMNQQTGALAKSMGNLNTFTANLAGNNDKITATMTNLEKSTKNLSEVDVNGTISKLQGTIERLNSAVAKIDSKDGSIGRLLNDNQLYDNLANTTRSLNILMDDIRVNPKRYVSISIFGGKAKKQYLTSPLPVKDSTAPLTMQ
ncbi:MAG: mammalian cell entry protein [Bacteroidota bacterium]|nr:mammalian cell entry protein [Bacteroidota bacterium]